MACTNVGSLGCNHNLKEHNINVRRKVVGTISSIRSKYNSDNIALCLQECGHFDVTLRPHFDLPLASDKHVTFGANDNGVRGVATYALGGENTSLISTDLVNEICTISVCFRNSRDRVKKVGIVNCYRNISKNYERTVEQTKAAITRQIDALAARDIKQFVVCGDFNSTSFKYDEKNARELMHTSWYHQANDHTAKHRIDKCFTNMPDAGILEVMDSCEKVESHSGNKVCVIYLGKEPVAIDAGPKKITSYRKLIDLAIKARPVFNMNDNSTKRGLEMMASEISEVIKSLHLKSVVTKRSDKKNAQRVLISRLEGFKDEVITKANAAKIFYEFGAAVKSSFRFQNDTSSEAPPLEDLGGTLVEKLDQLYVAEEPVVKRLLGDIYGVNKDNRGFWTDSDNIFMKILLSTSDSGARDYMNLSLKITKAVMRNNPGIRDQFRKICEGCLRVGYFPAIWCRDQISFLWKNKGEKSDPAMYRPITIAPSLGKHLEKLLVVI